MFNTTVLVTKETLNFFITALIKFAFHIHFFMRTNYFIKITTLKLVKKASEKKCWLRISQTKNEITMIYISFKNLLTKEWPAEVATGGVLWKKVFLEVSQNSQENTCVRVVIKKETLTQVLSCEFCEISKSTFLNRTPLVAASGPENSQSHLL